MSELQAIFDTLKERMKAYQPPFTARMDDDAHYDLWSEKDLVIDGRKRKDVYFAGLIIQKNYVGLYYMPVYASEEVKNLFSPELLSRLKGKSCFHIKKLDPQLLEQIDDALKTGFDLYRERGWV